LAGLSGLIDKDLIGQKWHEVLARVKQRNHSLSLILRVCKPKEVNGSQVCLAFRYKFHKDRINETQIKSLVEQAMNEVYGQPLTIEAIVDEGLEIEANGNGNNYIPAPAANDAPPPADGPKPDQDKNLLDNLLKTFGGKIVQ
jgi:hypothetical protein